MVGTLFCDFLFFVKYSRLNSAVQADFRRSVIVPYDNYLYSEFYIPFLACLSTLGMSQYMGPVFVDA